MDDGARGGNYFAAHFGSVRTKISLSRCALFCFSLLLLFLRALRLHSFFPRVCIYKKPSLCVVEGIL